MCRRLRVSAAAAALAIGCCAVALATQREVTDVRPALLQAFTVDSRATAQYSQLVKSREDSDTVTRAIQEEILPAFSRDRAKLDSLGRVPSEQERTLADLRQYLSLREAYWRQRAAAIGRTDDASLRQLDDADRSADVVMRRLLATR